MMRFLQFSYWVFWKFSEILWRCRGLVPTQDLLRCRPLKCSLRTEILTALLDKQDFLTPLQFVSKLYIIYFKNVNFPKFFCPLRSCSPPNPLQKRLSSVNHGNDRNKVLCITPFFDLTRPPPPKKPKYCITPCICDICKYCKHNIADFFLSIKTKRAPTSRPLFPNLWKDSMSLLGVRLWDASCNPVKRHTIFWKKFTRNVISS